VNGYCSEHIYGVTPDLTAGRLLHSMPAIPEAYTGARNSNYAGAPQSVIVYSAASVGVVHDISTNSQVELCLNFEFLCFMVDFRSNSSMDIPTISLALLCRPMAGSQQLAALLQLASNLSVWCGKRLQNLLVLRAMASSALSEKDSFSDLSLQWRFHLIATSWLEWAAMTNTC
jgi:hypothetical protein